MSDQIKKNSPIKDVFLQRGNLTWAHRDSNPEPTDYESAALTVELWALNGVKIKANFDFL